MGRIYTHSVLEAAVCEAKLQDALKPRYGKVGPARQGQVGHRLAASYCTHLYRVKREVDLDAGRQMWAALKSQITASDEHAVADSCVRFIENNTYPWVASAQELSAEEYLYFSVPDRRPIPADRVHLIDGPVFRIQRDLAWVGDGPNGTKGIHTLDWKWHRVIEHVAHPETNRQLLRYCSAAYGPEIGDDVYAYIGYGRSGYYEHATFNPECRATAWNDIIVAPINTCERLLENLLNHDSDRCVGPHCRDCDLRRGCDAALRYPFELTWSDETSRQEKLTAILLVNLLRKDMLDRIKGDIGLEGAVKVDDYEADIDEIESLTFDRDTIERVCGGVLTKEEVDRCFKATKTQTLKILTGAGVRPKEREEMLDMMRPTAERKLSSKLKVSKSKKPRPEGSPSETTPDTEGSA